MATKAIDNVRAIRRSFQFSSNEEGRVSDESESSEHEGDRFPNESPHSRSHRNQTIFVKIKIAFVFLQVILLFQEVYLIQYPTPYI